MRAAIYDPYLDTLGGGERYVMTVAKILEKWGYVVDVEWEEKSIAEKLSKRFGFDLSNINFIPSINKGRDYDLVFWLSDGSVPNLAGKKIILHFQVPFVNVNGKSIINKIKLSRIKAIVCNSKFTKSFIDSEYGVKSLVLYPPVDVESFNSARKENLIINVGRFSQLLQSKRQDVLAESFKKMVDGGLKGWRLILAGGSEIGGREFVEDLQKSIKGYPIRIIEGPDFQTIRTLYSKAKIFWSASGFEIDDQKEPQRVEHFGITVVESMASGCVPVVTRSGGHKEIIEDNEDGILWGTDVALIEKTLEIIKDRKKLQWLAENARKKADVFSRSVFENEFSKIIS